ncbi:hypothetical protein CSUB01_12156 [Colletotrichum sublineola]|uniref:Fungal N-terminal domain-containing protein n=1 Tax=Colletotrichum sublineola TaxID=1173701 RepID=A0A066X214_COLSU|nr:hypothetical protein CSUB01_12156 [Colletotrichum sublineola]
MEAIGATAAIIQLLEVCTKCGSVATEVIRAYHDAPRELSDLVSKMDIIRFRIQQLTNTQSGSLDIEAFLPDLISDYFIALLETQYQALLDIKRDTISASGSIRATQFRWATIDRRKAQRVTKELKGINKTMDSVISLATFRRLSFLQLSINAVSASQSALLPELNALVDPIRTELSELRATLNATVRTAHEPLRSGMTQMQSSIANIEHTITAHPQKDRRVEPRKSQKSFQRSFNYEPEQGRRQIQLKHQTLQSLVELQKFETSPTSIHIINRFPFEPLRHSMHEPQKTVMGTVIYYESDHRKRLRLLLRARLRLFCQYLVNFEIAVRFSSRYWHMMPWLECRATVFNVRSRKAEIFAACQTWDLDRVKTLLNCHEASINDVDEGQHRGLLEYAIEGLFKHDTGPAITYALLRGATDMVRLMLQNNLNFESNGFSFNPGLYLCSKSRETLFEQVHLLRSLGFEDWNQLDVKNHGYQPAYSIIHAAARLGILEDVIYAIEVLDMDVNFGHRFSAPLDEALFQGHIEIAAVLHELGAVSRFRHPNWWHTGSVSRAQHWLLLKYSRVEGSRLERRFESDDITLLYWRRIWITWFRTCQRWHFESAVRIIQHILFHSACLWQLLERDWFGHYWRHGLQLRAHDLARAWSYGILELPYGVNVERIFDDWYQKFEDHDETRIPNVLVRYSYDGWVEHSARKESDSNDYPFDTFDTNLDLLAQTGSDFDSTIKESNQIPHEPTLPHTTGKPNGGEGNQSNKSSENAFRTQEMFDIWQSITTDPEGRRQLSRYPLVKALCCALQLSGYRAEMDNDGNIWYDVDDGDPYFDCLEQPLEPNDWEGPGLSCEMCADPERFGLGYIVQEAEEGLRRAKEERRKLGKERPSDRD